MPPIQHLSINMHKSTVWYLFIWYYKVKTDQSSVFVEVTSNTVVWGSALTHSSTLIFSYRLNDAVMTSPISFHGCIAIHSFIVQSKCFILNWWSLYAEYQSYCWFTFRFIFNNSFGNGLGLACLVTCPVSLSLRQQGDHEDVWKK